MEKSMYISNACLVKLGMTLNELNKGHLFDLLNTPYNYVTLTNERWINDTIIIVRDSILEISNSLAKITVKPGDASLHITRCDEDNLEDGVIKLLDTLQTLDSAVTFASGYFTSGARYPLESVKNIPVKTTSLRSEYGHPSSAVKREEDTLPVRVVKGRRQSRAAIMDALRVYLRSENSHLAINMINKDIYDHVIALPSYAYHDIYTGVDIIGDISNKSVVIHADTFKIVLCNKKVGRRFSLYSAIGGVNVEDVNDLQELAKIMYALTNMMPS